jgi:hypothetical protein
MELEMSSTGPDASRYQIKLGYSLPWGRGPGDAVVFSVFIIPPPEWLRPGIEKNVENSRGQSRTDLDIWRPPGEVAS